jgi:tryptophanyl-tRNA synthetase
MMGELTRMTQFKDKSVKVTASNGTEFIPTGIFLYPILMVADILLYDANYVIVGSDQKQHVELTRDLAERMNKRYGQIFTVPEPVIPEHGARIMDLINPTIKMSKSNANENGTIFLLDPPEKAVKKIMGAKTDSLNKVRFNPNEQPGVSNLVIIYSCFSNKSIEAIETKYKDADYGIFKKDLALLISDYLKAFQTKYQAAIVQYHVLAKQLEVNAKHCLDITSIKLNQVYRKIGLIK